MTVVFRPASLKMSLVLTLAVAGALMLGAGSAFAAVESTAEPNFPLFSSSTFAVGPGPHAVVTGDFNNDGRADAATANFSGNTVSVLLGAAGGGFSKAAAVKVGGKPAALVMGDFNRDGKTDLAVVNQGSASVSILINDGTGHFTVGSTVTAGSKPMAIAEGDLNRDGKTDLVVTNYGDTTISVLTGNGAGGFTVATSALPAAPFFTGVRPRAVAVGDFNGDGCDDVAVATFFRGGLELFDDLLIRHGDGAGGFLDAWSWTEIPGGSGPIDLRAIDYNGNGRLEIVGASWAASPGTPGGSDRNILWVYSPSTDPAHMLASDGGFNALSQIQASGDIVFPGGVALGEFTNPAHLDAVASIPALNEVRVVSDADQNPFDVLTKYAAPVRPAPLAVGDPNRDGALDILAGGFASDSLRVLRRTLPVRHGLGFQPTQTSGTGDPVDALLAGDFNRDGACDVLSTTGLYDGNGNGTFGGRAAVALTGIPVATGDFNRDGWLDFATVSAATNQVIVYLADGTGHFPAGVPFATGNGPADAAVGDVNRDGSPDLVVVNSGDSSVSVLLGDGAGGFAAKVDYAAGSGADDVALGDLDNDGDLDIVTANATGASVSVLRNNGSGVFAAHADFNAGFQARSVSLADFNRDGRLDVATAGGTGSVGVLLGNGAGSLGTVATVTLSAPATLGAAGIVATDVTTDGIPDIVVPTTGADEFAVLVGDGAGGFAINSVAVTTPTTPAAWAVADVNGDGVDDLVYGTDVVGPPADGALWVRQTDTVPPDTSDNVPSPPPGRQYFWTNHKFVVTLTGNDNGAGWAKSYFRTGTNRNGTPYKVGSTFSFNAPTTHANDGLHGFDFYSLDKVGNVEWRQSDILGIDTVPPKVGAAILPVPAAGGWTNAQMTYVTFSISDDPSGKVTDVSGPVTHVTRVAVDGTLLEDDASVAIAGPWDHSNDGIHTVSFVARDFAGNRTTGSLQVKVDTLAPNTYALKSVTARSGGTLILPVEVVDQKPCGPVAHDVTIVVTNSAGKVVARFALGTKPIGTAITYETYCSLRPGSYRYSLLATDAAGNAALHTYAKSLTVR